MKLVLKLFGDVLFEHKVQTKQVELLFDSYQKVPVQDFDTLIEYELPRKVQESNLMEPKEGTKVAFECSQLGSMLKSAESIGLTVPECNAVLEVIH